MIKEKWKNVFGWQEEVRSVVLEGQSKSKVEDWVNIVMGTGRYREFGKEDLKERQDRNPIKFK